MSKKKVKKRAKYSKNQRNLPINRIKHKKKFTKTRPFLFSILNSSFLVDVTKSVLSLLILSIIRF